LRLWDVASGASLRTFTGHSDGVYGCAFSPDGRTALSASWDDTLRLWDVASGAARRTFTGHSDTVEGCAVSPDGRMALSASNDRTLRLWDVATGGELAQWRIDYSLLCCAWSPMGAQVVAGDASGGVHLLEVVSLHVPVSPEMVQHGTAEHAVPASERAITSPAEKARRWWPFGRR
jgi:WD40 repeat protein